MTNESPSQSTAYTTLISGYPTAPQISDTLQDVVTPKNYSPDPAQLLSPFVVPGIPIVTAERGALRGREGDRAVVNQNYISKAVLPVPGL